MRRGGTNPFMCQENKIKLEVDDLMCVKPIKALVQAAVHLVSFLIKRMNQLFLMYFYLTSSYIS